ncbi:hypothetical protein BDF19DRAFT_215109 [Syncephalis fuscata]|nr:hypothetical protein BDF19DRAFT_215109 [Syncephalis fuscata]
MFIFPPARDLGTSWKQNATRLIGIPLYPLGELNGGEYLMGSDSVDSARERIYGVQLQLMYLVCMIIISSRNLLQSLKLVLTKRNALSSWCCLIMSLLGFNHGILAITFVFPNGLACRHVIWHAVTAYAVVFECSSLILLQRAYYVVASRRWLILVGVLFTLPIPAMLYVDLALSPATIETYAGCTVNMPHYKAWIVFGAKTPIDTFLSAVFIRVVYKQYKIFGSEVWNRLARDGIQAVVLVVTCNVFCAVILLTQPFGAYTDMFYFIDWLTTTTLLVNNCRDMREALLTHNKPKTKFMAHISDIATAKTARPNEEPI